MRDFRLHRARGGAPVTAGRSSAAWVWACWMVLALVVSDAPVQAGWPTLGLGFCTAVGDQDGALLASDGAGGAIIVWQDLGPGVVDVFAQRVLASGSVAPLWPAQGRALLGDPLAIAPVLGGQALPVIVADGGGGAIIAWQDGRDDAGGADIYAQHVLGSGALDPAWPPNGVALCTAAGLQDVPSIVSDGAGGAIVAWMDGRSATSNVDIYAQHVLASGHVDPAWPANGTALCTAPSPQAFPGVASDGRGGAIVTWYDFRPAASGIDIYAQHVLGSGAVDPLWPANGRAICAAAGSQFSPKIVADGVVPAGGAGGGIISWEDSRDGTQHVYALRVLGNSANAPGWPTDGRALCTAPIQQAEPIPVSDGAGGAVVAWRDLRNGHNDVVYAQHILASGGIDAGWPVNGIAFRPSTEHQSHHAVVVDGAGGAIAVWQESFDVHAHHVLASGVLDPSLPADGQVLIALPSEQRSPSLLALESGDAMAAWTDFRSGPEGDLYALPLSAARTVGVDTSPAVGVSFASPSPNPASGMVRLGFSTPGDARVRLDVFDITGRRVRVLHAGSMIAGVHELVWDLRDASGQRVAPGLYFAALVVDERRLTQRIVTAPR